MQNKSIIVGRLFVTSSMDYEHGDRNVELWRTQMLILTIFMSPSSFSRPRNFKNSTKENSLPEKNRKFYNDQNDSSPVISCVRKRWETAHGERAAWRLVSIDLGRSLQSSLSLTLTVWVTNCCKPCKWGKLKCLNSEGSLKAPTNTMQITQ